jgi:hypothetical protein
MQTAVLMVIAIAATMVLGVVPAVYATTGNSDNDRNDFGQDASEDLADDRQMGEHSSDPSGDGTDDPDPRVGIGNVFNQGDPKDDDADPPDSKHPSDTGNRLCEGSDNEACTDEGDPND